MPVYTIENRKPNMVSPEPRYPTTARPEQFNTAEAQANDLKITI